jgi:RNA polymerase sigma-70 factor (ECF subfamily)
LPLTRIIYAQTPEPLIVRLAASGDRDAFGELVRRRQSGMRNFMRRLCRDPVLADDLAQQVFLQAWRKLAQLKHLERFPAWLKQTAVNTWLQHVRKHDPLAHSDAVDDKQRAQAATTGMAIDLDRALALLPNPVRLCIVLSYHERMSHAEIADAIELPLGTVKSHIRRGTEQLRLLLADYAAPDKTEGTYD